MKLAARVIALVAATCGSLAAPGMPPASSATVPLTARSTSFPVAAPSAGTTADVAAATSVGALTAATSLPATTSVGTLTPASPLPAAQPPARSAADQSHGPITLTSVSPSVLRPGDPLVVTGTIDLTTGPDVTSATAVRVLRGRSSLATRWEVGDWADATGPVQGTELARHTLDRTGPPSVVPFRLEVAADEVRLPRAFGVIPIAVELLTDRGASVGVVRTFVGWHQSADYTSLSLAWLLPVTVAPDPALYANDEPTRTSAWDKLIGSGSRLERMLRATADFPVGYAVDPAILGPARGPETSASTPDPVTSITAAFGRTLAATAGTHAVFALPFADPDLAALTEPELAHAPIQPSPSGAGDGPATGGSQVAAVRPRIAEFLADQVERTARLGAHGVVTQGTVAWPEDGTLPPGREEALRAGFGDDLAAILVSGEATDPTARLTPPTAGVAPLGSPVLRWDDRISDLLTRLRTPGDAVLAGQEFVAQTSALLGERPSIARTLLAVQPRGFDATTDPDALAAFLTLAGRVPWVHAVTPDRALRPGNGLDAAPPLPTTAPTRAPAAAGTGSPDATLPDARTVTRVLDQHTVVNTLAELLTPTSPAVARWFEWPAQAISTRWRHAPAERDGILTRLEAETATVFNGVTVIPLTTNFLADEGVLQLTVVNTLGEPVRGVRAVLQPGNGRIVVVEPGDPVDIAARAKATVSVRVAVLAQGLVPVTAWVTTASGTRIGTSQQLTIRAAPPGAWLYVGMIVLFGLILVAGVVRAIRRPPRVVVDTQGLDPVDPTPETPLVAPVERHTSP